MARAWLARTPEATSDTLMAPSVMASPPGVTARLLAVIPAA
jgi:hypothetical protein